MYSERDIMNGMESSHTTETRNHPATSEVEDPLLRWEHEPGGDQVLSWSDLDEQEDEHGESEEEDESEEEQEETQDEPAKTWADLQQSRRAADSTVRCELNHDQIVEIINEEIAYYTKQWTPNNCGPRKFRIPDEDKMREDAEAAGQRRTLITKHKYLKTNLENRLDKLCACVLESPHLDEKAVRKQCESLEVTIHDMKQHAWLLSVYKGEPENDNEQELGTVHSPQYQGNSLCEMIDLDSPRRSGTPDSVMGDTEETPVHFDLRQPATRRASPPSKEVLLRNHDDQQWVRSRNHADRQWVRLKNIDDEPEQASIKFVSGWRWSDLVATQDRKRIVSKVVRKMKKDDRERLRLRLRDVDKAQMIKEITGCLEMMSNPKGRTRMPGVLERDQRKIEVVTRLFLSWWLCDNYLKENPSRRHLEDLRKYLREANEEKERGRRRNMPGILDLDIFYNYVSTIMTTTFSEEGLQYTEEPFEREYIVISD